MPPCLIYYLRTTPYERLLTTVCLRQPAPLRELSTLNVAAAWRLAQCWRPALVAARVLLVRSPDAQFCPQIPLGKVRAPKNVSAARAGRNGASRRRRLFRGEAREKKTAGECKRCELARSYSSLCLVSPMAQEWRVVARGVHVCAVPLRSPIHTPLRWLHGRKRGNWQGARPKRRRPRSSCTAQLGQPVPQDSPSTKSSCSGGVGSASGGLFCAIFALNHTKKAKTFSRGAAPAPPKLRACAGVHPLNRGQTPSYTCRHIRPFDRMHSKESAI